MKSEIKEIREMLDFFSQPMMFEKRKNIYNNEFVNFEKNGELLREGLIKSYGADYVISNLKKVFDLTSKFENYKKNNSKGYIATDSSTLRFDRKDKETSVIELIIPNNKTQIERIEKFLNVCGWYVASNDIDQYCKNGFVHLVFEKKYQKPLKNNKIEVPNIIYHITQKAYLPKIKEKGLVPKSGNKISKHPERIYFLTDKLPETDLSVFSKQFFIHTNSDEYIEYNKMVLLTIDVSSIRNTINFYSDPNADGCVYCYDNIPPKCIINIEEIY